MQKAILFSIFLSSLIFQNNTTAQTKHFQGNWIKLEGGQKEGKTI